MKTNFAGPLGIGFAAVTILVAGIFFMQRGDVIELPGKILKVRTMALDQNSTEVVIDFRVTNPTNLFLQVGKVSVEFEDAAGTYEGEVSSERDAKLLFEGKPELGPKFLPTLLIKQRLESHTSTDYMVAAR